MNEYFRSAKHIPFGFDKLTAVRDVSIDAFINGALFHHAPENADRFKDISLSANDAHVDNSVFFGLVKHQIAGLQIVF